MISDPIVIAECDTKDCGYTEQFGLSTTSRGYDERDLANELRRSGWLIISDNEHLCPNCAERLKGDESDDD